MDKDKEKKLFSIGRILANVILLSLIMLSPWWVYLTVALIFLFYFEYYFEVVLFGIFIDALYGTPVILSFPLFFTFISLFLFLLWSSFKERIHY